MTWTIHSIYLPNLSIPGDISKTLNGIASTRYVRKEACQSTDNADKWNKKIDKWVDKTERPRKLNEPIKHPSDWEDETIFAKAQFPRLTLKKLVEDEIENRALIASLKKELNLSESQITDAISQIQAYEMSLYTNTQPIEPLSPETKMLLIKKSHAEIFGANKLYYHQLKSSELSKHLGMGNEKLLSLSEIIEKKDLDALKISPKSPIQDQSQFLDLYAQLHDAAMSKDKEEINFTFYGNDQLINRLFEAFKRNPDLIPKNIRLSFSPLNSNVISYISSDRHPITIKGTGSINYNYIKTINDYFRETIEAKAANNSSPYTIGNINSLSPEDLDHFKKIVMSSARSKEEMKEEMKEVSTIYSLLCGIAVDRYIQERIIQQGVVDKSNGEKDWGKLINEVVNTDIDISEEEKTTLFSNDMTLEELIDAEENNNDSIQELVDKDFPNEMITRIITEFIDSLRKEYSSKEIAQIANRATVHSYLYTTFERSATVDELLSFVHNRVKEPEISDFVDDPDSQPML